MFSTAINDLTTAIQTVSDYEDNSVARGEPGKVNTIKKNGCLIMPDFKPPQPFPNEDGAYPRLIPFTANCFIIAAQYKTLALAEDAVLDLTIKTIQKVMGTEFDIDMEGNHKNFYWEFTDVEWTERSASLCVVAVEFTVNLQL